jgi:hypothetical protein
MSVVFTGVNFGSWAQKEVKGNKTYSSLQRLMCYIFLIIQFASILIIKTSVVAQHTNKAQQIGDF